MIGYRLDLDKKDMSRVLSITIPAMVEMLFAQLFAMVDTMMLGHTGALSTASVAAVGYTNSPINLLVGIMSAFNVGTTAAVAWSLGAGDLKSARDAVRSSLVLNLAIGTVATLLGFFFARPMVLFMGAGPETADFATEYMQIVAVGMLFAAVNMAVTSSLRGAGQTRLPMLYNLGSNLLNVIGNYLLIYGHLGLPAMGVSGAALSTTISRGVATLASLLVLFKLGGPIRLQVRDCLRFQLSQIKRILRVGVTTAIEQALMQVGFMLFTKSVSGLGYVVLAAHNIGLNINGLSWVPSQAFGVAATALVGQSMGAGQPEKARDYAKLVHRLSLIGAILTAALFLAGAHVIAGLYIDDVAVAALAAGVLRLMTLGMPGIATQMPISAALRGAGDTLFPLLASMVGIWIFRVLVAPLFIHTFGWGLTGAWLCIVLDQSARAIVVYARFASGKWMTKRTLAVEN